MKKLVFLWFATVMPMNSFAADKHVVSQNILETQEIRFADEGALVIGPCGAECEEKLKNLREVKESYNDHLENGTASWRVSFAALGAGVLSDRFKNRRLKDALPAEHAKVETEKANIVWQKELISEAKKNENLAAKTEALWAQAHAESNLKQANAELKAAREVLLNKPGSIRSLQRLSSAFFTTTILLQGYGGIQKLLAWRDLKFLHENNVIINSREQKQNASPEPSNESPNSSNVIKLN